MVLLRWVQKQKLVPVKKSNSNRVPESINAFQKAGPYLSIVYAFFGAIILFGFVGFKLDSYLDKRPLFLIIGVFSGFALGFYRLIKVVKDLER